MDLESYNWKARFGSLVCKAEFGKLSLDRFRIIRKADMPLQAIKVYFDGGRRNNQSSFGWVIFACYDDRNGFDRQWYKVAAAADLLGDVSTLAVGFDQQTSFRRCLWRAHRLPPVYEGES